MMQSAVRGYFIALSILLTACGPQPLYERSVDFEDGAGWNYADSLTFTYEIEDTTTAYDLVLTVDHTDAFAYQNFYVRLSTHLPNGHVLTQPLSLDLADNFGRWYADCDGIGGCTNEISIQTDTRFEKPGTYQLVVSQFSREDPLPEITGMGFRVLPRG